MEAVNFSFFFFISVGRLVGTLSSFTVMNISFQFHMATI